MGARWTRRGLAFYQACRHARGVGRLGVLAQHPDAVVRELIDANPAGVARLVIEQAAALRCPPVTVGRLLATLDRSSMRPPTGRPSRTASTTHQYATTIATCTQQVATVLANLDIANHPEVATAANNMLA